MGHLTTFTPCQSTLKTLKILFSIRKTTGITALSKKSVSKKSENNIWLLLDVSEIKLTPADSLALHHRCGWVTIYVSKRSKVDNIYKIYSVFVTYLGRIPNTRGRNSARKVFHRI